MIEQVKKLQADQKGRMSAGKVEGSRIERERQQVESEESRILEAYRLAKISPVHLGQELEKLTIRRNALASREAEVAETPGVDLPPPQQMEKSTREYCRQAAQGLQSFTHVERQQFLRTLLQEVTFQGSFVRMRGLISIPNTGEGRSPDDLPLTKEISFHSRTATIFPS